MLGLCRVVSQNGTDSPRAYYDCLAFVASVFRYEWPNERECARHLVKILGQFGVLQAVPARP